jgi:DMSO/TMAO reductase YedYZ molybdopterin-dependent catalytic subunit
LRRLAYGLAGIGVFGAIGVYCALTANASQGADVIPTIFGTIAAAAVMWGLVRTAGEDVRAARAATPADPAAPPATTKPASAKPATVKPAASTPGAARPAGRKQQPVPRKQAPVSRRPGSAPRAPAKARAGTPAAVAGPALLADRRGFVQAGVGAGVLALLSTWLGRAAQSARFSVAGQRAKIVLPEPVASGLPRPSGSAVPSGAATSPTAGSTSVPTGADLGKTMFPWDTPNGQFYRIDTALAVPEINPDSWSLRIHGMVDKPITLTYKQILAMPLIERWITLCCVSNTVGGPLIGNARWLGAPLAPILRAAGISSGSDQLILSSSDGMTIGAPTKVVMDGRDAMIAVGMNGVPLPIEHGFPARIVVPGLYGYVSACKWVVDINATTFNEAAYWVEGGWAQQGPVKLESRIDTPRSGARVKVGSPVPIAGIAWDQHVGVSAVEVQVGGGAWLPAQLATVPSTDTWRQWVVSWTPPSAGSYVLKVRATDAKGDVQTTKSADPYPSGATGLHTVTVRAA